MNNSHAKNPVVYAKIELQMQQKSKIRCICNGFKTDSVVK